MKPVSASFKMYNWLKENNCLYEKNSNKERTHLALSGGCYSVSHGLYNDFLKKMAEIFDNNEKLYISENRTDIFKYIIDIDYESEEELEEEKIYNILKIIYNVISDFTDNVNKSMIVVKPEDIKKKLNSNDELVYKTGIHIYFNDIYINSDISILLRSAIIQKLKLSFNKRPSTNTWEDIIDISIYKGAGLRMVLNNKTILCSCKGKDKKNGCALNCNYGKFDGGRPYIFYKEYDNDFNEVNKNYSIYELLKNTSIRTDLIKPNLNIKMPYPDWFNENEYLYSHKCIQKKPKKKYTSKNFLNSYDKKIKSVIDINSIVYNMIKEIIKMYLDNKGIPANILDNFEIIKISEYTERNKRNFLICTNFKYCLNVNREHQSNNVYFLITHTKNIYQKCHSESINSSENICSKQKILLGKCGSLLNKYLFDDFYYSQINNMKAPPIKKSLEQVLNELYNKKELTDKEIKLFQTTVYEKFGDKEVNKLIDDITNFLKKTYKNKKEYVEQFCSVRTFFIFLKK